MYCPNCKGVIPENSAACPSCGAVVSAQCWTSVYQQQNGEPKMCPNCSAVVPSDSKFCSECRTQLNIVRLSPEEEAKRKKQIKIFGISVAALVGVVAIIVLLCALIKPTINLNEYLTISVDGYNTLGTTTVSFDEDRFAADYSEKMNRRASSFSSKKSELNTANITRAFIAECVEFEVDKEINLSNGDIIKITWQCDDDLARSKYGYILKYEDIEHNIDSLEEPKKFDPFEGVNIAFEGIAPNGEAYIESVPTEPPMCDLRYELDVSDGLSNGDTVTLNAYYYYGDITEYCIQNYGIVPSTVSKTYEVEGLQGFVRSSSEISEDCLEKMKKQANDIFNADAAKSWAEESTLKEFNYLGYYLLVNKDSDIEYDANAVYLAYKVTANNSYSDEEEEISFNKDTDYYWFISFTDLLTDYNGMTYVDTASYDTPTDTVSVEVDDSYLRWNYYGFESLDALYKSVVTSNLDVYTYEDVLTQSE